MIKCKGCRFWGAGKHEWMGCRPCHYPGYLFFVGGGDSNDGLYTMPNFGCVAGEAAGGRVYDLMDIAYLLDGQEPLGLNPVGVEVIVPATRLLALRAVADAARGYIHCATMQQWDKLSDALDALDEEASDGD